MSLAEEYRNQSKWRDWNSYIDQLPVQPDNRIFDLGCGIGTVSSLLARKVFSVTGIDRDPALLKEAKLINDAPNIRYIQYDLRALQELDLPLSDAIWSSFSAAYFPDFKPVLFQWLQLLKPGGWIGLVEMGDLLGHEPMGENIKSIIRDYYDRQCRKNIYDFEMGGKIHEFMVKSDLIIIHEDSMPDPELTFSGPASPEIYTAWENRLERMYGFRKFLGDVVYLQVKKEFLNCIKMKEHFSKTVVNFIIAKSKS